MNTFEGNDEKVSGLVEQMNRGEVDCLIFLDVNPVYDFPDAGKFVSGLNKVGFSVAICTTQNETLQHVKYICPDHHYLESWNDAEHRTLSYSLTQPTIRNLFNTRQAQESFLIWSGNNQDYQTYLKEYWEENILGKQSFFAGFDEFWLKTLQKGILELDPEEITLEFNEDRYYNLLGNLTDQKVDQDKIELTLYQKIGIGTGKHANNPWLQELPDPISKVVWDNYIALSPDYARELGLEQEDLITINQTIELPVLYQPGQPHGTASVAMGYGRTKAGKAGNGIGKNVFELVHHGISRNITARNFMSMLRHGIPF
ncbi:MAG: hypothetical protein K8R53_03605 [Bacteroidales bacterium]|nr:hypothetical protein [Bacteroidales bacterium]